MFFFFVGGVSPRTVQLGHVAQRCANCGSQPLREQRIDHVLSLFLLPVWTVKKGAPFLSCDACGWTSLFEEYGASAPPPLPPRAPSPRLLPGTCPACGRPVAADFAFCPSCGLSLK